MSATADRIRVLFVTNAWPHESRPGHGAHAAREVRALEQEGVDVRVLPIHGFLGRWAYAEAAREVARLSRGRGFDIVHGFLGHAGAVARMQRRAPLVVTYTGSDLLGDHRGGARATRKSRVEAIAFRQLARVASATITCAAHMELALPPSCRARNHVVPTSVPSDLFRPIPRAEARAQLGWDRDQQVVLFAADPARQVKNHALAVAAHARLVQTLPSVALRVTSDVPWQEMPVRMSAADALLLTSRSEGSPGAVKEAMACELPVVSVAVGDVPALLDGVPGCQVCAADAGALAAGLERALAHGRSPQARAAVAAFDVGPTARRVVSIYEHVLGRAASAVVVVA